TGSCTASTTKRLVRSPTRSRRFHDASRTLCEASMNTRRQFLIRAPLGFLIADAACRNEAPPSGSQSSSPSTPGAPPTFAAGPGAGPAISPATFAEAEKLMQVTMTPAERQQAADSWRQSMAPYLERRMGPRRVSIAPTDAPASLWNPAL